MFVAPKVCTQSERVEILTQVFSDEDYLCYLISWLSAWPLLQASSLHNGEISILPSNHVAPAGDHELTAWQTPWLDIWALLWASPCLWLCLQNSSWICSCPIFYKCTFHFLLFNFLKIFIYLAAPGLSGGRPDLVPWLGIEPWFSALEAQSLSHWTTREVPHFLLFFLLKYNLCMAFPSGPVVKNPPASVGYTGWIPGPGRSSGGRNGNPLQYSCLGKPHVQRSLVGYSSRDHKESVLT